MVRQRLKVLPALHVVEPEATNSTGPTVCKVGDCVVLDYFLPYDPWTQKPLLGHGEQGTVVEVIRRRQYRVLLESGYLVMVTGYELIRAAVKTSRLVLIPQLTIEVSIDSDWDTVHARAR